jgi:predicted transcriptional regulator
MTVPAFNVTPPTLRIIFLFKEKKVINKKEIIQAFTKSELVDSRLELLVEDNLIIIKNNKIVLTTYGKIIASLFTMYKKILGEEFGSG